MVHCIPQLLENAPARTIMDHVTKAGFEIRLVGGCVRDALLKLPMGDLDMASTALPQQIMAILARHKIHTIPTGLQHGTVTAVLDGHHFEITTLRKDVTTDGCHAEVAFTDDWQEDAQRRDFTINAMSVGQDGLVHDYFGGEEDLEHHTLRFVGDAATRIAEDYLRLLRFFRFSSTLGWLIDDDQALDACKAAATKLLSLSRERVQSELYKLILGTDVQDVIDQMQEYGIWNGLLPKHPIEIDRMKAVINTEHRDDEIDAFRRVIALLGWQDDSVLESILVLTREQKKRLSHLRALEDHTDWSLEKMLYFYGVDTVRDMHYLHLLPFDNQIANEWVQPEFPLDAETLMTQLNLSGAVLGATLKQAEEWWVDQGFKPSHEDVLSFAKLR